MRRVKRGEKQTEEVRDQKKAMKSTASVPEAGG